MEAMMSDQPYDLSIFVQDVQRITQESKDDKEVIAAITPLAQKFAATLDLDNEDFYDCNEEQGFSLHMLHEEEDHSNAVFLFAWLPGRGTQAHNHKTWGVVVGLKGTETETRWRRLDDGRTPGRATLEQLSENELKPGSVSAFLPDDIHTVWNDTNEISLTLHAYGKHINYTGRTEFDPEAGTEKPYILTVD
jgi:predicted metal-dependent enzyme (double-stranded beta helix superfamily)